VGQDAVAAGGGDVVGAAGPGGRYPHQTAPLVGQGEDVQAVAAMLAGVVRAVRLSGTALGGDEGVVDQDDLAAPPGDRLQGAVQARGFRGQQVDQLVAPTPDGGGGDVAAAGHVGQALIVPQHGQDDHRDPPGRQRPPPRPYRFEMAAQQVGEVVRVCVDSGRRHW
jgi:hypothetical protein